MDVLAGSDKVVLDNWAPLAHKRALTEQARSAWMAPTWVGDHVRRLTAYQILRAYIDNSARHFSQWEDPKDRDNRREYGDAALLVDVGRSKLLGEDVQLVVEEADTDLPDPPGEGDPPEDADMVALRATVEAARARQDWLRSWARDERLRLKMTEVERDAIGLGDGVYVVGWSNTKGRARLRVYDPGFYFPVLDDGDEDDYPSTVHIAWELPPPQDRPGLVRVRRITYRLLPVDDPRRLAYQPPGEAPPTRRCFLWDGLFTVEREARSVDDFTDRQVEWMLNEDGAEIKQLDLGIDFIPVVHVPNTVALKEHYGRSLLLSVAQILDELHSTDTDLSGNAATTGSPPITASGLVMPQAKNGQQAAVVTYGPGQMYQLADGGRMDVLDTSTGLTAMLGYVDHLLHRLSVNSRFPEEVLGRVNAAQVPSGFAMALAFGPLQGLVDEMRLVRDEKYRLLLKMVQRMAVVGGTLPAGDVLPAFVAFGSYLPSDLPGVATLVQSLLAAKAISKLTAINMLVEAGVPIDDAHEELRRIEQEDFEGAVQMLEATGDEQALRDRLGLKGEGPRPPGPPELPPGAVTLPGPVPPTNPNAT